MTTPEPKEDNATLGGATNKATQTLASASSKIAGMSRQTLIGLGVAGLVVLGAGGYFISSLGSSHSQKGTQQLTANEPGSNAGANAGSQGANGVTLPAPDATGRILEHNGVAINRDPADVTEITLAPYTYAQMGELWARADENGKLLLPPGKSRADATFFSGDDQETPWEGEVGEEIKPVTSITFEGELTEGYALAPGTVLWYTSKDFRSDPAYILIPKGNPGEHTFYVGSQPLELSLP